MRRAVDLTFALGTPRVASANVRSNSRTTIDICECLFGSNIRKSACRDGMRMLEPRHSIMRIDVSLLPALAASFMLAFARVGAMVMLLPGLGETNIPTRIKLSIAWASDGLLPLPLVE